MKVTVLGAGAWGTALAKLLHDNGHAITLWAHRPERLEAIARAGRNERHLKDIELPPDWRFDSDLRAAVADAAACVVAVPSSALRETTRALADYRGLLVTVTKGVEFDTGATMSQILEENAPGAKISALSGPTIAIEVAKGTPTAIVAASADREVARQTQELFSSRAFRVYSSTDIAGVELGGALKNVFAIAAGAGDGLGFGDNTKAALITRAIAELKRLGVACGALPETFAGLSGLGDLMVTCFSRHSRNRGFGERLGKGASPDEALAQMTSVVEGHPTTRSAFQLARKHGVDTPIIDEVHATLFGGKDPQRAVMDLMCRDLKEED